MKPFNEISSIAFDIATEEQIRDLPHISFSKGDAINACPKWGIIRYVLGKKMASGRAMALEAGTASHDVFAACRLIALLEQQRETIGDSRSTDLFESEGRRLFKEPGRFDTMRSELDSGEDDRTRQLNFCLAALHTNGFYDDPRDNRRTLVNIEESCMTYFDRMDFNLPVYYNEETGLVGIEQRFDLVVSFDDIQFIYSGLMDGIHRHKEGLRPHENKTSSRIGDAWFAGMEMSHQVTGYIVAGRLITKEYIDRAVVHGMAIPMPKTSKINGVVHTTVHRNEDSITDWLRWLWDIWCTMEMYKDDPLNAPMYTRSCNRYFHPCAFIPLCNSPKENQEEFLQEMIEENENDEHA